MVGLLVDREGFPLEIGCFEGNKAEKHTILPIISQFRARHGIENFAVVADAGMLSAANLAALDTAGCKFIVGSRLTKAPIDLESHFRWHGDYFGDGQVIDTLTPKTGRNADNDPALLAEPVWDPRAHPASWRAVWAYSRSRAVRDTKTLTAQENRARDVITGGTAARMPRFVKTAKNGFVLDQAALARARRLAGLKGYVTNIPATVMPATEVITSYHDLWHVEMVFPQLTKGAVRPVGRGREHVADVDLVICDDHAVDEQLGQLPPLLEGSSSQAGRVAWQNASMPSATACSSILCVAAASSCRCWASKVACRRFRSWRLRWSSARVMTSAR